MRGKKRGYIRVWEFAVPKRSRKKFERVYGPAGDWVRLFRKGKGYLRTELFRGIEGRGRYFTVDYWTSESAYENFRRKFDREFVALDKKCESLTEHETNIGTFENVTS